MQKQIFPWFYGTQVNKLNMACYNININNTHSIRMRASQQHCNVGQDDPNYMLSGSIEGLTKILKQIDIL